MTMTLNSSNVYARVAGISSTIIQSDALIIQVIASGFSTNDSLHFNTSASIY